jgi:hypothetical protein
MKVKKAVLGAILITILAITAQAARVGVVVTFPDGTTNTECVTIDENASAYEVLQQTSFAIGWSDDPNWGHGMCNINTVGCPTDNCYCTSDYWGFYIAKSDSSWKYSPVGFDAGDACWNGDWNSWDGHYCASDGDMLGFAYGPYGTKPESTSYASVCPKEAPGAMGHGGGLFNMTLIIPDELHKNTPIQVTLEDTKRNRTVKKAEIAAYDDAGGSARLYHGFTDANGQATFNISKTGEYTLEIRAQDYHTISRVLNILEETTTTTTKETTTSTTKEETTSTSTTKEATTTMLPHILAKSTTSPTTMETTTVGPSLGTTTQEETTTTVTDGNKLTGRVIDSGMQKTSNYPPIALFGLLTGLLLLYFVYPR